MSVTRECVDPLVLYYVSTSKVQKSWRCWNCLMRLYNAGNRKIGYHTDMEKQAQDLRKKRKKNANTFHSSKKFQ